MLIENQRAKMFQDTQQEVGKKQAQIEGLKKLQKLLVCKSEELKEGQIKSIILQIEGQEKLVEILIIRQEGKVYCIGGTCLYDNKSSLSNGMVFGNKLMCADHGCAYNIENGQSEFIVNDDLCKFYVEDKQGQIHIWVPSQIPSRILPIIGYRDLNDLRKVVIVGSGPAAYKVCEVLRSHSYTGELILLTEDVILPISKEKMYKSLDLSEKDLMIRDESWYISNNINYQLGTKVTNVNNSRGQCFVTINQGINIEYDVLVLATGTFDIINKRLLGQLENRENVYSLKNYIDYQKLQMNLQKINKLTVLGLNLRSLETVSTIKKKYKDMEITIVDDNQRDNITTEFGEQVLNNMINEHLENGVRFILKSKILNFNEKDDQITSIEFHDGFQLPTQGLLCFPNNKSGNFEYLENSVNLENMEYDKEMRIKVDENMRTEHKRVFAIGSNNVMPNFLTGYCTNTKQAISMQLHQGQIAAYNIMALRIPYFMNQFQTNSQFNKEYKILGYPEEHDAIFIDGDSQSDDFVIFYGNEDRIVGILSTEKRKKELCIYNEAMKLGIMPSLQEMKIKEYSLEDIEWAVRNSGRSGCYRDLIYQVRFKQNIKDSLWFNRDVSDNYYDAVERGYQNFTKNDIQKEIQQE